MALDGSVGSGVPGVRASVPRWPSRSPVSTHARGGSTWDSPQSFAVASDGSRVAFLRTASGDTPAASLWVYDVAEDRERVVFDVADAGEEHISAPERDRRERAGEKQTGVVAFAADPALTRASFVVGERLFLADLTTGDVRELVPAGPAFDPRPDPSGRRVAYVAGGALHVIDLASGRDDQIAADPDPDVHWGLAEFIAAEEMGRLRGYWWAPDGERLIAARADERAVLTWHVSSPDRSGPCLAPGAVSAGGHRERRRQPARCRDGRIERGGGVGSVGVRVRGGGALVGARRAARARAVARPARGPGARDRSRLRRRRGCLGRPRRSLDRRDARGAGLVGRGTAAHGGPSRRHTHAAVGRRGGHAAGPRGDLRDRRRRDGRVRRDARAHRDATFGAWIRATNSSLGSPTLRGFTARRRGAS